LLRQKRRLDEALDEERCERNRGGSANRRMTGRCVIGAYINGVLRLGVQLNCHLFCPVENFPPLELEQQIAAINCE
jgi:hypothetical protein